MIVMIITCYINDLILKTVLCLDRTDSTNCSFYAILIVEINLLKVPSEFWNDSSIVCHLKEERRKLCKNLSYQKLALVYRFLSGYLTVWYSHWMCLFWHYLRTKTTLYLLKIKCVCSTYYFLLRKFLHFIVQKQAHNYFILLVFRYLKVSQ